MKLMIASDIHGSAYYCEKMINAFKSENAEKLLLLGDILYHGPRNDLPKDYNPKQVIEMLNNIKNDLLCIRGNCDTEVDQMVLNFPIMAEYCILYLDNHMFFATHGHKFSEENPPLLKMGDILVNGHTHVPKHEEYKNFIYINPGSVSIPKSNSKNSYIIYENSKFLWKDLDGNIFDNYCLS